MATRDTTPEGRRRTFWIDERVIDEFAPVIGQYACGTAALAVYMVLARRAGRDGESWPRLQLIAAQVGASERTVQRALQLLALLGLVEITSCYEEGSNRQTSNLYTLLPPPAALPTLDPDPRHWPQPARRTLVVQAGRRVPAVTDARQAGPAPSPPAGSTPRQRVTPSPASLAPRPRHQVTPSPATLTPQEGIPTSKHTPVKDDASLMPAIAMSFTIAEIGLSSRQVWAATLAELVRGGTVSPTDLEAWLRPAAIIGRDGNALVLGVPNPAARDRIATRLLPGVRAALAQVLGVALPVTVVASGQAGATSPAGQADLYARSDGMSAAPR